MLHRAFVASLAAATALTALYAAHHSTLLEFGALRDAEYALLDLHFQVRGPIEAHPDIALVVFDDRTLNETPELFEHRLEQARLLRAIHDQGARVVGLDLLYQKEEHRLSADIERDIRDYVSTPSPPSYERGLLEKVAYETSGDQALEEALKTLPEVVLALHAGDRGADVEPDRSLSRGRYGQVVAGDHLPPSASQMVKPLARFARAAKRLGYISVTTDTSGSTRRISLGARMGPEVYAPFSLQLFAAHEQVPRSKMVYDGSSGRVHVGDAVVEGDDRSLWLNWLGPEPFPTYSVTDVVTGSVPDGALRDAIVIVGFTQLGQDLVNTPFGHVQGVEVHATALDNLLRGRALRRADVAMDTLWTALWGFVAALLFASSARTPGRRLVGSVALTAASFAAASSCLAYGNLWLTTVGPLMSVGGATVVGSLVSWLDEGRQRQHLRRLFSHYLSDELVEELLSDPDNAGLHGERRELSVLFTDIRDFTTISEQVSPLELARFLNAYFEPMTSAVLSHHGYVDKFIGDAVMAVFGAPVRRADHAADACATVLRMHEALDELQSAARSAGFELAIGAGINTGDMVVGNMGSSARFDYTVLGDAVNLASRLEGLTKHYGVFCIVGPATAHQAGEAGYRFRPLDLVRVKGKVEPVPIFELLGDDTHLLHDLTQLPTWEAAITAWRDGDFTAARRHFGEFAVANSGDRPCRIFLERLEELEHAPAEWDGVFTHLTK